MATTIFPGRWLAKLRRELAKFRSRRVTTRYLNQVSRRSCETVERQTHTSPDDEAPSVRDTGRKLDIP
jgi:hypothetical protein